MTLLVSTSPQQQSSSSSQQQRHGCCGILMIVSPAKTLHLEPTEKLEAHWTQPDCNDEMTRQVATFMKHKTQKELAALLSISTNLATTAHEVRERGATVIVC